MSNTNRHFTWHKHKLVQKGADFELVNGLQTVLIRKT